MGQSPVFPVFTGFQFWEGPRTRGPALPRPATSFRIASLKARAKKIPIPCGRNRDLFDRGVKEHGRNSDDVVHE